MCEGERERSTDLEQLRCMLFPHLSRDEGWRRIDAAFNGASDSARTERIERLARHPDLEATLLQSLWRLAVDEST